LSSVRRWWSSISCSRSLLSRTRRSSTKASSRLLGEALIDEGASREAVTILAMPV
jgi:hypothetical protein